MKKGDIIIGKVDFYAGPQNKGKKKELSKGVKYKVRNSNATVVTVKCDNGEYFTYSKIFFTTVSEQREKKLKRILNECNQS